MVSAPTQRALPPLPALVEGAVQHNRRGPIKHRFRNRIYQWLVDLDDLPRMSAWLRPFSTFVAADHIGDPQRSIRENIETFCAAHDVDVSGHQIIMLANARILGHTFDPLSVFWAIAPDGSLTCVVAEVHNTYGERHAYLLDLDDRGRTEVEKAFYVSPFYDVEGRYDLSFTLSPEHVSSSVVLKHESTESDAHESSAAPDAHGSRVVFSATFGGRPHPATPRRLLRLLVLMPFMTHRTSLLIRMQGVWLWLRRLPVVPRPTHHSQEGTS